ncbi:TiaS agmantine-binding domain-containing protein [Methanolacinia petrolearia]|uniref:TiaS agmantine-binding domain-containing protein n=1 Tax=Methanolacinia petrolearia TaxID=54120 RepID=UPI003BAD9A5F
MLIGIDDTDSPAGMCTTYLGAVFAGKLREEGYSVDSMTLARLNPNARYKTRGNAAVCIETNAGEKGFDLACSLVDELADLSCERTNPGVAMAESSLPSWFYTKAVTDFLTIEEAAEFLDENGAVYKGWKNGRGLIGAAAALSASFDDSTYELLAYRHHEEKGERIVDRGSIFLAEEKTYPHTWDSVDFGNNVVVCVPHTPDPVLYGIRGESPEWVKKAVSYIKSEEPFITALYRTNQGTDAHLLDARIADIKEDRSYRIRGNVSSSPSTGEGGHVSFLLSDEPGISVRCMAYEPTKEFRDVVRKLIPGDEVTVCGSFKGGSINLEKIEVISLAEKTVEKPPVCSCGKRMTSAGTGKGYKCRRCGEMSGEADIVHIERELSPGWYEVPPVARRHLSKPLVRDGLLVQETEKL